MKTMKSFDSFKLVIEDIKHADPTNLENWSQCDPDTERLLKEYFYEMIDDGFSFESKMIHLEKQIRYLLVLHRDEEVKSTDWYRTYIIEYGKKFYDFAFMAASQNGMDVIDMDFSDEGNKHTYMLYLKQKLHNAPQGV